MIWNRSLSTGQLEHSETYLPEVKCEIKKNKAPCSYLNFDCLKTIQIKYFAFIIQKIKDL